MTPAIGLPLVIPLLVLYADEIAVGARGIFAALAELIRWPR